MKKIKVFRGIMIFWTLFIGIGAVAGATGMLVAPDGSAMGMQKMLPFFQALPLADVLFQNYIFPGISLLIVNGITNITAFFLIWKNKRAGAYLGCIFGVTLMLWIIIQFIIFPANFMSTIYFIFGFLQFACGYLYIIFLKQSEFVFDESRYGNIGSNTKVLVAYFSRLGYTKTIAFEKAMETGGQLFEITTPEKTEGFLGFAWLGRFGMHGWEMPIDPVAVDVSQYERVIIVMPIHVFTAAPPVKGFCKEVCGKVKRAEYIGVHFRKNSDFVRAFEELDALLGVRAECRESVVCKFGKIIERRKI